MLVCGTKVLYGATFVRHMLVCGTKALYGVRSGRAKQAYSSSNGPLPPFPPSCYPLLLSPPSTRSPPCMLFACDAMG